MKPKITWIVIADGAQAKVFTHAGPGAGLKAVPELMWGEEPLKAREIMADKPGRSFSSGGHGRSAMEYSSDPVQVREAKFAKDVADVLNAKFYDGAFERLVIAAAPTALGDLRPHLSKELQQAIVAEIPKDLTNLPTSKLGSHFDGILAVG